MPGFLEMSVNLGHPERPSRVLSLDAFFQEAMDLLKKPSWGSPADDCLEVAFARLVHRAVDEGLDRLFLDHHQRTVMYGKIMIRSLGVLRCDVLLDGSVVWHMTARIEGAELSLHAQATGKPVRLPPR